MYSSFERFEVADFADEAQANIDGFQQLPASRRDQSCMASKRESALHTARFARAFFRRLAWGKKFSSRD
jgi:hypothetical protein